MTGLPLLQLPEGFTGQTYGCSGDPMDDGIPTSVDHDGMAVVRSRVVNGAAELTIVRNHADKLNPLIGTIPAPAVHDTAEVTDDDDVGRPSGGSASLPGGKFVPADGSKRLGAPEQGGTLYMAKVAGEDKADLLNPTMVDSSPIAWVEVEEPDLDPQPLTEAPHDADNTASGPVVQGRNGGALRMSCLEGGWSSAADRLINLTDTSSGIGSDEEDGIVNQPG